MFSNAVGDYAAKIIRVGPAVTTDNIGPLTDLAGEVNLDLRKIRLPTSDTANMFVPLCCPLIDFFGTPSPKFDNIKQFTTAMAHFLLSNPVFQETNLGADFALEAYHRLLVHRIVQTANQAGFASYTRQKQRGVCSLFFNFNNSSGSKCSSRLSKCSSSTPESSSCYFRSGSFNYRWVSSLFLVGLDFFRILQLPKPTKVPKTLAFFFWKLKYFVNSFFNQMHSPESSSCYFRSGSFNYRWVSSLFLVALSSLDFF